MVVPLPAWQHVVTEGRETAYSVAGQGATVFLVHGVGLHGEIWGPQVGALGAEFHVVRYDTLGHGRSGLAPASARLGDYTGQLVGLMDALDVPCASLVGHSMGALVAIATALDHPDRVVSVTALNAVYGRSAEAAAAALARADLLEREGPTATLPGALDRWFGTTPEPGSRPLREQVAQWLAAAHPVGYARAFRVFARADEAIAGRIPDLTAPALFLTGELDPHSTPEMSRRLAADAPRGRAVVLPGERHLAAFVSPQTVNVHLLAFLREVHPATAGATRRAYPTPAREPMR
jgi:pimeloyl-ACP methyl ester carboxylesterase